MFALEIAILLIIVMLTACDEARGEATPTNGLVADSDGTQPSGQLPKTDSGVKMIVNSVIPREGITITLENKTASEFTYGSDFTLYLNGNDSWETVQPIIDDWGFDSIGYDIAPQSTTDEIFIDWSWLYGELPGGNYIIKKEILLVRSPGDYDKYLVEAEFSIPGNINTGPTRP